MTSGNANSYVSGDETVCRFITQKRWIRYDRTVKQDAFMPPKDLNLSVTRQLGLTEGQLWCVGRRVEKQLKQKTEASLCGRADLLVGTVRKLMLEVAAAPLEDNPYHAHIVGWGEKHFQKLLSIELARACTFAEMPPNF